MISILSVNSRCFCIPFMPFCCRTVEIHISSIKHSCYLSIWTARLHRMIIISVDNGRPYTMTSCIHVHAHLHISSPMTVYKINLVFSFVWERTVPLSYVYWLPPVHSLQFRPCLLLICGQSEYRAVPTRRLCRQHVTYSTNH